MSLAKRLKEARQDAGLSQKELADRLNMNLRTYGSYEKKNRPKIWKSPHHANTKSAYLRGFYTVKNN